MKPHGLRDLINITGLSASPPPHGTALLGFGELNFFLFYLFGLSAQGLFSGNALERMSFIRVLPVGKAEGAYLMLRGNAGSGADITKPL